jgi:hypothetical protein
MSDVLSQREVEQVMLSALRASARAGVEGLTEGEMARAVQWAHEARIMAVLLSKVLSGQVGAYPVDGEMTFGLLEDER